MLDTLTEEVRPGQPKPYEQMQYPGQRIRIDVKVVPCCCIADPELKLHQYTAIDEYSRYRILGAYSEQSTYSSADFLRKVVAAFFRRGVKVECIQTDNGFELINRFSNSKRDLPTPSPFAPSVNVFADMCFGKRSYACSKSSCQT